LGALLAFVIAFGTLAAVAVPAGYAGQCRRMQVNLADGTGGSAADFQFK
jgi:hypothetical protein